MVAFCPLFGYVGEKRENEGKTNDYEIMVHDLILPTPYEPMNSMTRTATKVRR